MDVDLKKQLAKVANTIRLLSVDAVQKANSGHPGLPMGCAEFAAYLYGSLLRHNPKNPDWLNRDRFVLSAGHGSAMLYACLHLAGFPVTIEDLQGFRQLHSITPGHPERHMTKGVEATTGPLGQGVGNAVGMALALKLLGNQFNRPGFPIFDAKVYCLAGDGCMMEGVSSEVSSLAGHLRLDNLILIYDANKITLDGNLAESSSEDVKMRYRAYGWQVIEMNGYDFEMMELTFSTLSKEQRKPCLIFMDTIIGKGAPHKEGSHKAHGAPLGAEEVAIVKKNLGFPEEEFFVPQGAYNFFAQREEKCREIEERWKGQLLAYARKYPALYEEFLKMQGRKIPADLEEKIKQIAIPSPIATRSASQEVIQRLADFLPHLYGGSADLSESDRTLLKKYALVGPGEFHGRNIKFGVREFGMATIATGLSETGMITPFVGTFLTFSDYMRNAIRLAALSRVKVIYQFTHDSIFLGEDGPTHQPIEHLAALRAIPNLQVIRPADAHEVKMAWLAALHYEGPTALILSRQNIPSLPGTDVPFAQGVGRGAYIVRNEKARPQFTLFATGSEVGLALYVADALEKRGKAVRVVSMPSWELFEKQDPTYIASIVDGEIGIRVSIEAATSFGWAKWIGREGIAISMEQFGASAPAGDLAQEFGFNVDSILDRLLCTARE
jgi:transketolase